MRRQAEFVIVDEHNINVELKSTARIPRDFVRTMEHLALQMGYGDISFLQNYKLDSVQLL